MWSGRQDIQALMSSDAEFNEVWFLRLHGYVIFKGNDKGIFILFFLLPAFPPLGFHWNFHSRNVPEAHSHGSLLLFPRRLEHF